MTLGMIVARGPQQLDRADDMPVQPGHKDLPFRHQHDTLPVGLHHRAARHGQPAEAVAIDDGRLRGVAEVLQVHLLDGLELLDIR